MEPCKHFKVAAYVFAYYLAKADDAEIQRGIDFFKQYIHLDKVYIENHRGKVDIPPQRLQEFRLQPGNGSPQVLELPRRPDYPGMIPEVTFEFPVNGRNREGRKVRADRRIKAADRLDESHVGNLAKVGQFTSLPCIGSGSGFRDVPVPEDKFVVQRLLQVTACLAGFFKRKQGGRNTGESAHEQQGFSAAGSARCWTA